MLEWALGIHSLPPEHQTFELKTATRPENRQELELRWRQFAVFQRLTAYHLSDELFAQAWDTFHNTRRQRVHEPNFQFRSFMASLIYHWDPQANFKLQKLRHYSGSPPDVGDQRTLYYTNRIKQLIGSLFKKYWYYPTIIKFTFLRSARAPFFHSSYYKPQTGDMLVAQWFDPRHQMTGQNHNLGNRAIVLRREREKTRWDHYRWDKQALLTKARRSVGLFFNENFLRFSYTPTVPLTPIIEGEPVTTAPRTTAPRSQSRHQLLAPPRRAVSVHYISFRQFFFTLSNQNFSQELVNALNSLSREDPESVPTIFLDLRNAPEQFNLHWYLQTLSIFSPNQPAAIIQTAQQTKYLRSLSGAFTSSAPLVVLVNHHTRRYAELLAATLQESGRALVLGAGLGITTAGNQYAMTTKKFTRTNDHPYLPSTSGVFEATYGQLFTPSKRSYNYQGVRPDITLPIERYVYTRPENRPDHQLPKSARRVRVAVGSATRATTESCFSPLPPSLIETLKKRSDRRLLQRTYRRQVEKMPADDESAEIEYVYLSFSDAFHRSPDELASETHLGPCKPECDRVSLNPDDFKLDKNLSLQRGTKYLESLNQPVNAALQKKRLRQVMLEEEELREALNITLDYGALVSYGWRGEHTSALAQ